MGPVWVQLPWTALLAMPAGNMSTPRLLLRRVKQDLVNGNVRASYLIDSSMSSFFAGLATSGSTATSSFAFLRALLLFPQEQTQETSPPFAESTKGFVTTNPLQPIIVKLATKVRAPTSSTALALACMPKTHPGMILACSSQAPTKYVPNISLRIDYSQAGVDVNGAAVTPFVSLMFTDFVGTYPSGLPATASTSFSASINIVQAQGIPLKAL